MAASEPRSAGDLLCNQYTSWPLVWWCINDYEYWIVLRKAAERKGGE